MKETDTPQYAEVPDFIKDFFDEANGNSINFTMVPFDICDPEKRVQLQLEAAEYCTWLKAEIALKQPTFIQTVFQFNKWINTEMAVNVVEIEVCILLDT